MTEHRHFNLPLRQRVLALGRDPVLMGIINVTPDSFSDGGDNYAVADAVSVAQAMVAEGAGIIDVGGESTRPGADPVSMQDELDRVMPVLDALAEIGLGAPVSIDTRHVVIADQAIQAGAQIINDVDGLQGEPELADLAVAHGVPVVAMHWDRARDTSRDIMSAMKAYFERTIAIAEKAGLSREALVLDPGFGFAKSFEDNYTILRRLSELADFGYPLLVGMSRKSMLGKLLGVLPKDRDTATAATSVLGYLGGAHIFRVHAIGPSRDALRVAAATLYGPPAPLEG